MISVIRHYLEPIMKMERKRAKLARDKSFPSILQPIIAQSYAHPVTDITDVDILSIDFETTGLNPMVDQILSIGCVEISGGNIDLSTASHTYIKGSQNIKGETAIINHIVPELLVNGVTLDDALGELFERMRGKLILAHGMNIERRFLLHYLVTRYDIKQLPWLWVDTLRIERSLIENQMNPQGTSYQLNMLREKYGLPDYTGHNALTDALSAAELFFAQLPKVYGNNKQRPYSEVISRSI